MDVDKNISRYAWFVQHCPGRARAAEALLDSLDTQASQALRFLYGALPLGDMLSCAPELLLSFVTDALAARDESAWGRDVPADVFRSYVLYPRVNNEPLEPHRAAFRAALWPRVRGLSMLEAALEVNYWCLEKATYRATDIRTASPATVVRRAFGRCGEESTLLACALRAVCIPARQCYVPRWAHCDDNHAWVEAWVDGAWHYMGACEPEPQLDMGWFTASATRAMLVHTRGFGWDGDSEPVLDTHRLFATINRTGAYAAVRKLSVTVKQGGAPFAGAYVRFEVANMGELYPLYEGVTNTEGRISWLTGLGSLHLHVHDGMRYVTQVIDVRHDTAVTIDFDQAIAGSPDQLTFGLTPPAEAEVPAPWVPEDRWQLHLERLRAANQARATYEAGSPKPQGNGTEIMAFMANERFTQPEKQLVLDTLSEKDWADCTAEALADALGVALAFREGMEATLWQQWVLAPRVALEPMRPVRAALSAYFAGQDVLLADGPAVWDFLSGRVDVLDEGEAEGLAVADPRAVLAEGCADRTSMDVLFVHACRALGIAARINPATGAKEAYAMADGGFMPVGEKPLQQGVLSLRTEAAQPLEYGVHFTIGRLRQGVYETLRLENVLLYGALALPVPVGHYRVLTCARQIDGSVLVASFEVDVTGGDQAEVQVHLRQGNLYEKLLHRPLDATRTAPLHAHMQGHDGLLLFIEPGQEPTAHLLTELKALRERIAALDIRILLICQRAGDCTHRDVIRLVETVPGCKVVSMPQTDTPAYLRHEMGIGDRRLPLAIAINRRYEGLFAFANYNIGSAEALTDILAL